MRTLILVLAFITLPFGVQAASLNDFNGKWGVDLVTTTEKTPGMKPDEELLQMVFIIDAKAKTMRTEFPGRQGTAMPFTVEKEEASQVIVKRADGRILRLQPYGKGQLAVGEIKDNQPRSLMYFVRRK